MGARLVLSLIRHPFCSPGCWAACHIKGIHSFTWTLLPSPSWTRSATGVHEDVEPDVPVQGRASSKSGGDSAERVDPLEFIFRVGFRKQGCGVPMGSGSGNQKSVGAQLRHPRCSGSSKTGEMRLEQWHEGPASSQNTALDVK